MSLPSEYQDSGHLLTRTDPQLLTQPIFDKLHGATRVKMYDGSFNKFLAIGDYKGLFITIDKNKKNWFPTGEEAPIADFIAQVEILNQLYQIAYTDEKLEISKLEK